MLVRPVRGINLARLRPSGMKSLERRACPLSSGMRNHASGTSSIQYELARKESLSFSVHYEESSTKSCERRASLRPSDTRIHAGGTLSIQYKVVRTEELHLVRPVRGFKQAGFRPSGTKPQERRTCPRSSGMRNQASGTSFIWYEAT